MSFNTVCDGCGAPSGPSVGVCPYCKSSLAAKTTSGGASYQSVAEAYENGRMEEALNLANTFHALPEEPRDPGFAILYAKILLEVEAPGSQVRALLAPHALMTPVPTEVVDLLELTEAKSHLKKGLNDPGERRLRALLMRSPSNALAHFFLGSHLFWAEGDPTLALSHLERCVHERPNFLRAWGCLAAIYSKLGNRPLADRALGRCLELETNPNMREFFESQLSSKLKAA